MIEAAALEDLLDRNPVAAIAQQAGARLRRSGRSLMGSCPICSTKASGSATRFEIKPDGRSWVCAVCEDGGDAIALVMRLNGCDFLAAVEQLGGAIAVNPQEAARRQAERDEKSRREALKREYHKERERRRLFDMWRAARPIAGSLVETYFAARAINPPRACRALRFLPAAGYYHGQAERRDAPERLGPRCIHTGPAMLAAITRADGSFGGLHMTYLAADGRDKAAICDPDTGEALPAKKVRGSKSAGQIALINPPAPRALYWGEGIETVFSVAQLAPGAQAAAFWCAVDLGNLGGKSVATIAHPDLKTERGRALRVPGPDPDLAQPAAQIPESVDELVILGDGDSDPFTTRQAVLRCAARYARPETSDRIARTIRCAWARYGGDFNDMLQEARA